MKPYDRNGIAYARIHGQRVSLGVPYKSPKKSLDAALSAALRASSIAQVSTPAGIPFAHVAAEAIRLHYRGGLAERQQVPSKVVEMLEFFGQDVLIQSLKPKRIDEFKEHLMTAQGNTGKTVNRKLAVLSKILHLAVEWEMLDAVPRIKREVEQQGRIRWLTPVEIQQITDHWLKIDGLHLMIDWLYTSIDTGLRPSELRQVTSQDIQGGMLHIHKGAGQKHGTRTIPLTPRALGVFQRLASNGTAGQELFGWLTEDHLVKQWDKMRDAISMADDPLFVAYTTRHTFAVRMLEAGVDVFTLKDLMGHSKIETTLIYAHVTGRLKVAAMDKLAVHLSESTSETKTTQWETSRLSGGTDKSLIGLKNDLSDNQNSCG